MLNFNEFQEYIKENLLDFLPEKYQNAKIELNKIVKNNGTSLDAVTIKKAESCTAPIIYLDGYFEEYKKGENINNIMMSISNLVVENAESIGEYDSFNNKFSDFGFIKDKIVMVIINAEKNKKLLAEVPHQIREDLAIIYKIVLENDNKNQIKTITIKNECMDLWKVTAEEIYEIAMKNTENILPAFVQSFDDMMKESFSKDGMPKDMVELMFEDKPLNQQMFIITNNQKINGAGAIFYEGLLDNLAKKVGTDLYILPSSIHECIAISTDTGTPNELAEMVREINGKEVAADEQLSDNVYRYSLKEKTLRLANM